MPLALDPQQTLFISLQTDRTKSDAVRPEFESRFITVRERMKVDRLLKETEDPALTDEQVTARLDAALTTGIVGWRNITGRDGNPITFSLSVLDDILTASEKWELVYAMLLQTRLSEAEKKRSASLATSAPASSAEPAAAESA